ncbi:HAD family phosphatase [Haloechinothrix sp. YIM 98757]|uniref:HAD family phosphatase n=1 Tax=Haloechinothrix aidingensis TaxID=2752311 RepID=A0A838A3F1_9PSEU|nr:HAD family phosphatase [Haloechinothrix aidingensis]MBA0125803.1 HAD family phosphatase [Haloechinothrix aidingensis]
MSGSLPVPAAGTRLPAAVLWDMDGTLIDSERLWDRALYESAERLGGRLSPRTRALMVGKNADVTLDLLLREVGLPRDSETLADADSWLTKRMSELFRTDLRWRDGAAQALRLVRGTGVPTALVTSTTRELTELALETVGRDWFDAIVCGDEVDERNKPDPEPYRRAAHLLGVDPEECLAVEDSPTGVSSAEDAGCVVLVVPSELEVPDGPRRRVLDSLTALDEAALTGTFPR